MKIIPLLLKFGDRLTSEAILISKVAESMRIKCLKKYKTPYSLFKSLTTPPEGKKSENWNSSNTWKMLVTQ